MTNRTKGRRPSPNQWVSTHRKGLVIALLLAGWCWLAGRWLFCLPACFACWLPCLAGCPAWLGFLLAFGRLCSA